MTYTDDRPPIVDEPPWDDPGPEPPHAHPGDRTTGDTPPRDLAAERAVLTAALNNPAALTDCSRIITAADFYLPDHERIWRALTHLAAHDQPTAAPAVIAHLLDTGQLRSGTDGTYIHDLWSQTFAGDPTYYATRVDNLARRRRAITGLQQGLQKLRAPGPDAIVDDVLNTLTNDLLEARDNLAGLTTPTTWSPVDLGPVLAGEHLDPPPTMLMRTDGVFLFYDGAVHTVSGESESGKTWLCLLAALQLIQDDHDIVFLDFEDRADRVIGRLLALGATLPQIHDHFSYIRPDRPLDDDGRTQLAPVLAGTKLVILDGVTEAMTMHGFDLNSNADSATFQGLLPRWIADHGPAVVMIDHVVKDKEKQDRFALGAQHKLAGIDGAAYLVKMIQPFARGKRGLARVDVAKDRPGHVREHTFGRTIAEFTLDASAGDLILLAHLVPPGEESGRKSDGGFEPTYVMEKISRAVQLTPGLSKASIENLVNGKAVTKRTALEILVTRGYIGTKVASRGKVEHFHIKPYYADGDPSEDTDEPPEGVHAQEAS